MRKRTQRQTVVIPPPWFTDPNVVGAMGVPFRSTLSYLAWVAWPGRNAASAMHRGLIFKSGDAIFAAGLKIPRRNRIPDIRDLRIPRCEHTIAAALDKVLMKRRHAVQLAKLQLHNRWSLNRAAGDMAEALEIPRDFAIGGPRDVDGIKRGVWRESLPGLAMAWGLFEALETFDADIEKRKRGLSIENLLTNNGWIGTAIKSATKISDSLEFNFRPPYLLIPTMELNIQ